MKVTLKYVPADSGTATLHINFPCTVARMAKHAPSKVNTGSLDNAQEPICWAYSSKARQKWPAHSQKLYCHNTDKHVASLGKLL